jgi:hypothetical protein
MDWLTTSTDESDTASTVSDDDPKAALWSLTVPGGEGDDEVPDLDALERNFLGDGPQGPEVWAAVPQLQEHEEQASMWDGGAGRGRYAPRDDARPPSAASMDSTESGESSSDNSLSRWPETSSGSECGGTRSDERPWTTPAIASVDLGLIASSMGFTVSGADTTVDLARSHKVALQAMRASPAAPLRTQPAAVPEHPPEVPVARPAPPPAKEGAAAPRAKARKKRAKRIPAGESAMCPYCQAAVIIDGEMAPELGDDAQKRRFARYRPRPSKRKDNRLASWYVKYGYSGPPYCKGCSESFNSHLLRQNAQAARASCSRGQPCQPCKSILSNFSIDTEGVYHKFDTRNAHKTDARKSKRQVKREPVDDDDELSTSLVGQERPKKRANKPFQTATAVAIGCVAVLALLSVYSSGTDGGSGSTRDSSADEQGWICGAGFSALMTGTVEAQFAQSCGGADDQTIFECAAIDECYKQGLVPMGQRTCRCDGCVRPARCVGWQLEGHSAYEIGEADGIAKTCPQTAWDPTSVPGRDPNAPSAERLSASTWSWLVPAHVLCNECSELCSDYAGCARFECGSTKEDAPKEDAPRKFMRSAPFPDPVSCTLYSEFAWPQPIVGAQALAGPGQQSAGTEGVIWSGADGAIWQFVLDPSYWHNDVSELEEMQINSESGQEDLHYMWKFDPAKRQWHAVQSSLKQRPSPRSDAATWTDPTGSLFVFSGGGCGMLQTNPLGQQQYIRGARDQGFVPLVQGCIGPPMWADLWRYDTGDQAWQLLRSSPEMNSTGTYRFLHDWPAPRGRSTVWLEADAQSAGQPVTANTYVAWMFGGMGSGLGVATPVTGHGHTAILDLALRAAATTELWQYKYSYVESAGSTAGASSESPTAGARTMTAGSGQWTLVTIDQAEAHAPTRSRRNNPVYVCSRENECPAARINAGSWKDPRGETGGWLFGGASFGTDPASPSTATPMYDLWQFNGDVQQPLWRSISRPPLPAEPGTRITQWPPAWVAPSGWARSTGGGEIWVVGESGEQFDVYTGQKPQGGDDEAAPEPVVDGTQQPRDNMWVFMISEERWVEVSAPGQPAGGLMNDPNIPWPGERRLAATGDGVFFGGAGVSECDGPYAHKHEPLVVSTAEAKLTGLWTWRDQQQ